MGWPPQLSTAGSLGPQRAPPNGGRAPRAGGEQTRGPAALQPSACSARCQSKSHSQPRCKWEVGKGTPSLYGRSRQLWALYNLFIWVFLQALTELSDQPNTVSHPGCQHCLRSLLEFPRTLHFLSHEYFLCDSPILEVVNKINK